MWCRPPFDPHVEGDWLYGRGGADMKAGIGANIFAMDALRACGLQPAATVYLQSVTEEECTGNGALSALVRGYRADAAIIPEPEDDTSCAPIAAFCGSPSRSGAGPCTSARRPPAPAPSSPPGR